MKSKQELVFKSNKLVEQRLKEFTATHKAGNKEWFSELCFCILTANSKAQTALDIQKEIGTEGFLNLPEEKIREIIYKHRHRFYNNKTKYIIEARQYKNIKDIITIFKSINEVREFLVKNIKGLGYKEASHFLRNVGFHDVAIIDRHILRFMEQQKLIKKIPKVITRKQYLECEKILSSFNIPLDKLDLIIWQQMTGKVLK
jgi:N-glycosylase/DNA lyase